MNKSTYFIALLIVPTTTESRTQPYFILGKPGGGPFYIHVHWAPPGFLGTEFARIAEVCPTQVLRAGVVSRRAVGTGRPLGVFAAMVWPECGVAGQTKVNPWAVVRTVASHHHRVVHGLDVAVYHGRNRVEMAMAVVRRLLRPFGLPILLFILLTLIRPRDSSSFPAAGG